MERKQRVAGQLPRAVVLARLAVVPGQRVEALGPLAAERKRLAVAQTRLAEELVAAELLVHWGRQELGPTRELRLPPFP